jgi:hypothetical protein
MKIATLEMKRVKRKRMMVIVVELLVLVRGEIAKFARQEEDHVIMGQTSGF